MRARRGTSMIRRILHTRLRISRRCFDTYVHLICTARLVYIRARFFVIGSHHTSEYPTIVVLLFDLS